MNIFLIFYQDVVTYLTIIMFHDRISISFLYSNIFRYVKICHPLKTLLHFGKRRTLAVIILIWVISIIFSVAWTNFTEVSMIFIFIISNKNLYNVTSIMRSNYYVHKIFVIRSNMGFTTRLK